MTVCRAINCSPTIKYYLVTSREINVNAQQHFGTNNIKAFDKDFMAKVWTEEIRKWDESIKLYVYSKKP